MNAPIRPSSPLPRRSLLERLKPLASDVSLGPGQHPRGAGIFTYCAIAHERLLHISLERPVIGIILSGRKEVWLGDTCRALLPGEAFALPSGVDLHVVNEPDEGGTYETLLIEVEKVPPGVPLPHAAPGLPAQFEIRLPLVPDLVEALCHAARALMDPATACTLGEHRLAEILLILRDVPEARPLFAMDLGGRVAWLIRADPARSWQAAQMAALLGLSESTLRRRLADDGMSFRGILRETRLDVAHDLLRQGGESVMRASEAAGYASRSHFARHYRARFGTLPRDAEQGAP